MILFHCVSSITNDVVLRPTYVLVIKKSQVGQTLSFFPHDYLKTDSDIINLLTWQILFPSGRVLLCQKPQKGIRQKGLCFYILIKSSVHNLSRFFDRSTKKLPLYCELKHHINRYLAVFIIQVFILLRIYNFTFCLLVIRFIRF